MTIAKGRLQSARVKYGYLPPPNPATSRFSEIVVGGGSRARPSANEAQVHGVRDMHAYVSHLSNEVRVDLDRMAGKAATSDGARVA